jgi:hypothetical protein
MMSKLMFSVTKGARLVAVLFALVLALAALQAFGARSAEAHVNLVQGSCCGGTDPKTSGLLVCWIRNEDKTVTQFTPSPTPLNWTGTDADNRRCGSQLEADYMDGAGGSDVLWGLYGNNTIKGGTGGDDLSAAGGADQFYPGDGDDVVYAGYGNDTIYMSADGQPDHIYAGGGTDVVKVTSCHLDSVDQLQYVELVSRPAC